MGDHSSSQRHDPALAVPEADPVSAHASRMREKSPIFAKPKQSITPRPGKKELIIRIRSGGASKLATARTEMITLVRVTKEYQTTLSL